MTPVPSVEVGYLPHPQVFKAYHSNQNNRAILKLQDSPNG